MWFGLVTTTVSVASSGCGSGDFVPPPPPELQGALGGAPGTTVESLSPSGTAPLPIASLGVRSLELILSGRVDEEETEVEKSAARQQAGYDKARLRISVTGESPSDQGQSVATPTAQAFLVRQAVARHPQVLIVEPADPADADLARAVREARAAKVPVVLLGRPLSASSRSNAKPASPPLAPEILVAPPPFADSAGQLVAAAIRNAKNAKLEPKGGALILVNTAADFLSPDRLAALRAALQAAGISSIEELRFAKETQDAHKLLVQRLRADSKPVLVFSIDSKGTAASNQTVAEIVTERPFIQAGYTSEDTQARMVAVGEFAAQAVYAPSKLIRKGISTAVAVAQGRDVPPRVEVEVVMHVSPEKSAAPSMQAQMRKQSESQQKSE
jgi:ABC-type sugar transport system substrate-binding protein